MSRRTILIMCIMALYCAANFIIYRFTGNTEAYITSLTPPYFGWILVPYWASVILDGINLYRSENKRKVRRAGQKEPIKPHEELKKAG